MLDVVDACPTASKAATRAATRVLRHGLLVAAVTVIIVSSSGMKCGSAGACSDDTGIVGVGRTAGSNSMTVTSHSTSIQKATSFALKRTTDGLVQHVGNNGGRVLRELHHEATIIDQRERIHHVP